MDDLDSLLADLGKPAPKKESVAADALDDLDDLLGSFDTSSSAAATPAAQMAEDDLDDLLSGLEATKPKAVASAGAADDLEDLLTSLDNNPPATPPRKPAPPASDDLDDLLSGLDSPAPRATTTSSSRPAPARAVAPAPKAAPSGGGDFDDLDDLMNDLEVSAAAPPRTNNNYGGSSSSSGGGLSEIDDLLGSLDSNARSTGGSSGGGGAVRAPRQSSGPSRGICGGCGEDIRGEVMTAIGKLWHPEHFACANCHTELATNPFYEHEEMPHCERCYKGLFVPRCAKCDQSITQQVITALGKKWHKKCFTCATCNGNLVDMGGSFRERGGYPYCREHYNSVGAKTCSACQKRVVGEVVNAGGRTFHASCFNCTFCHCAFTDGQFFEIDGKPYCKLHYSSTSGSICGGCGRPITGRTVNAMGQNFHPDHFVCSFCMNPLDGGNYKEKDGKPYCSECNDNLFG